MLVSSNPREHVNGKPAVKYVANIHGNEVVGRELMLHLIQVNCKYKYYDKLDGIISIGYPCT